MPPGAFRVNACGAALGTDGVLSGPGRPGAARFKVLARMGEIALERSKCVLYSFHYWIIPNTRTEFIQPMAELHGVNQRLQAALGRLDSAVESRLEMAVNQQRIDDLTKELEQVSAQNAELHQTTDAVARRLDDAIDRIRKILGE